jgi:DNA-binding response OmpR family regulator
MPHKVLAVDDNIDTILILSAVLEREGYEVITAKDGIEAVEKTERDLPAIVLLDLMMPKMNGFEVCRAIRGNSKTNHIPILMLTAKTDPFSREQGLALGANEYLTKPLNPKEILTKIRNLLSTEPPPPPPGALTASLMGVIALIGESIRTWAAFLAFRSSPAK